MSAHSLSYVHGKIFTFVLVAFCTAGMAHAATVNIHPGQDIPTIVSQNPAGTTFVIYPGTYRLTTHIVPKNGDRFIGQTACAPPKTSCPAILTGSRVIGSLATFNGVNYQVINQTQQGKIAIAIEKEVLCDAGWPGCVYPEDLFFDGVPYKHLSSASLPVIGTHQWWFDYTEHIIFFHDNPAGHNVETSVLDNAFGGSANNVTIQYLTVRGFASLYPSGAIGVSQGSNAETRGVNWTVKNCEVFRNHGWGVRVGYGIHILNSYIHDNGQAGIGGGLGVTTKPATQSMNSGILIQGNIINHNDYAHFNPDFGAGGIKIGSTSGITIRGNTIQFNEGSGVHFDDQTQNMLLDGNTITDNSDSDGVNQEMGTGTAIYRNNYVARNGTQINDTYFTGQLTSHASTGVNAYCNVIEVQKGSGVSAWILTAANRGHSKYPSYQYLATTGNAFHHNTLIWEDGATGASGYWQGDSAHQPSYFQNNGRPDFNDYHLSSTANIFVYDNNNSQANTRKTFAQYQNAQGDIHGTVDTKNKSGFPKVAITSPADQTAFSSSLTITAAASDKSGINRMEFYVDWKLQKTVAGPPYDFTFRNGTTGWHTIAAMAYSNAGIRNCYAVSLKKQ